MVLLTKIYTRGGDDGSTGLIGGVRRSKSDLRVEAIGSVDETNAAIGLARIQTTAYPDLVPILFRIQNDMFDLGADLATPVAGGRDGKALRISDDQVTRLEAEIDFLNEDLEPLTSFVLPGGSPAAATLHLARTIARRAERDMVRLGKEPGELVAGPSLCFINRLSDLLFVAARWANDRGASDVLWVPGQNR